MLKERIVAWLKRELQQARAEGFVVGLSGGVDSSTVAALCLQAAPGRVLGIILPCESAGGDAEDARRVAAHFGLPVEFLDLIPVYRAFLKILPEGTPIARANLKPRLRMSALYFFANSKNYLVAGTGNKSELFMGYFTKYGDGGVDLLPLGDLLKSEVRALAKVLGVPQDIVEKPPSAGLWPGQTDEGEMGISYAELDRLLEDGQVPPGTQPEKRELVRSSIEKSNHKRNLPKVFLKESR